MHEIRYIRFIRPNEDQLTFLECRISQQLQYLKNLTYQLVNLLYSPRVTYTSECVSQIDGKKKKKRFFLKNGIYIQTSLRILYAYKIQGAVQKIIIR